MKKLLFALVCLCLSGLASAEHHRGHAVEILNGNDNTLRLVVQQVTDFRAAGSYSAEDDQSMNIIIRFLNYVIDDGEDTRALLLDLEGDLDEARGIVSQPLYSGISISSRMRGIRLRVSDLVGVNPALNYELNQIMRNLTNVQFGFERVMWHIQDAIREEVYNDPDFGNN